MDINIILYLCCIAFTGGFVQGLTGFGVVLVALPLMGLYIDIKMAIPLLLMLGLVINFTLISNLFNHFDYKKWILLFIFSLPGMPLGIYVLKYVDPKYLELLIGVVVILTSVFSMFSRPSLKKLSRFWTAAAGFASGFLGGSIGATGPPIVMFTSLQPWAKEQIKTTMVSYFIITGAGILIFYVLNNLVTEQILITFGYCVLPLISGVICGIYVFNRINDALYRNIINFLLLILGIMMIIK